MKAIQPPSTLLLADRARSEELARYMTEHSARLRQVAEGLRATMQDHQAAGIFDGAADIIDEGISWYRETGATAETAEWLVDEEADGNKDALPPRLVASK